MRREQNVWLIRLALARSSAIGNSRGLVKPPTEDQQDHLHGCETSRSPTVVDTDGCKTICFRA
jgi:hypothetical protein